MILDPELEAQRIRHMWSYSKFPVDSVTIARMIGIQVFDTHLPESASGALIKDNGKDPIIALHRYDHADYKRFSCARMIGYYIYWIQYYYYREYGYVDLRSPSAANVANKDEFFANKFAESLLMPYEAVKKLEKKGYGHLQMALYFGVSLEAMNNRLKSIGLL